MATCSHYEATLARAVLWNAPMQVVLGATVAAKLGLACWANLCRLTRPRRGGGHAHGDNRLHRGWYPGAQCGSVLDRLILTDTASVWKVHEDHTAVDEDDRAVLEAEREVTMALVKLQNTDGGLSFPRFVNTSTEMQAAAPALEITRLLHMLGLGTDVLRAFAGVLLLTAALSVFIALWSAVRERRG
jgi:putative ABC transport system permease protein